QVNSLIISPDGSAAVCGTMLNKAFVAKVAPSGSMLWAKTYPTGFIVNSMIELSNGDHLLGSTSSMGLTRVDANGSALWGKNYSFLNMTELSELPNGDLVFFNQYGGMGVVQSDGTPITKWQPMGEYTTVAGNIGNDILGVYSTGTGWNLTTRRYRGPITDLSCAFNQLPLSTIDLSIFPEQNLTVVEAQDSLPTWTMSLGPPVSSTQLDLAAQLGASVARPGFDVGYAANVVNIGGVASGAISATLTVDPSLVFAGANPPPTTVSGNTISWNLSVVGGMGVTGVYAWFHVPASTPLGTPLLSSFTATQDNTEVTLVNNTATHERIVTGSLDPNMKEVTPADVYMIEQDSVLQYTIHFQNTGTDTAFTITVTDTLPPQVHASTFRAGPSSHPYSYTLTGSGVLNFIFTNILLPDSNTSESASHGFVSFTIKPDETLLPGTVISNDADIFFDFNTPIHTNSADVVLSTVLSTGSITAPTLSVFPVPSSEVINIGVPQGFLPVRLAITTPDGRLVRDRALKDRSTPIVANIATLEVGVYHITLRNKDGQGITARFVKE
ncbi:MAG TPA: T9SS type A sorting domain-containing protein, partial [Flavobacteriales bacterium]|nr:T9SS type A sorting domain-containing protein [Flavobacteriales bacterium]